MPAKKASPSPKNGPQPPKYPLPERELIVAMDPARRVRSAGASVASASGEDVSAINDFLDKEKLSLEPLFGVREEQLEAERQALAMPSGEEPPNLATYYRVRAEDARLDELTKKLAKLPGVTSSYVKPAAEPPLDPADYDSPLVKAASASPDAPPISPDFTADQGYLNPAPQGIDAKYAWTINGGRGAGINIIDIEGAWNFSHEDLQANQGGVVGGTPTNDIGWRNHGTAVIGEFGGDINNFGITGISPQANVRAISIFGLGSSAAIRQAADKLNPGDVILIELHRPGPRHNFQSRSDQKGYIAIEWWQDDYDAIRYATAKGVIVVEAAGNGAEDLDDALYNTPGPGFPGTWKNPFNPANPSSLAIICGAGAPPPGTHGVDHGPDRSRLGFSNYGSRVDCQGWGREVTTTGYGHLQGGVENVWYTDKFSGTSSASPIATGFVACVQGIRKASGQPILTPPQLIQLVRTTGSPQQDAPTRPATQRIGNRPDLKAAIQKLQQSGVQFGIATRFWDERVAYPTGSAASLWLLVNGAWRKRDTASASDRHMVMEAFQKSGNEVRVWYQGQEIVGLVVNGA